MYDTKLENFLLDIIREEFPTWEIENPNQKHHDAGYKRAGMTYFFREVLPHCDGGIFLSFRDGTWSAGVFAEAERLQALGCPIWEIDHLGNLWTANLDRIPVLSVEETRHHIRQNGKRRRY